MAKGRGYAMGMPDAEVVAQPGDARALRAACFPMNTDRRLGGESGKPYIRAEHTGRCAT